MPSYAQETGVIKVGTLAKIRRLYFRDKLILPLFSVLLKPPLCGLPVLLLGPERVNDFETPECINLVCNRAVFY